MEAPLERLAAWMRGQRWYAGHADPGAPAIVGEVPLGGGFRILLVAVGAIVYQVPVGADGEPATDDPAFGPALLAAMGRPGYTEGRVLGVEQSNTSIVVRGPDAVPAIVKVYRIVHHGPHPEVETVRVLGATTAPMPAYCGSLEAEWARPDGRSGAGSLAVAQEFIEGPGDGWRLALDALASGDPFRREAEELGRGTADLHVALASGFPTRPATLADRAAIVAEWQGRLDDAVRVVPAVGEFAPAAEATFAAVAERPWPVLQRVHGDLHLGQALLAPDPPPWRFTDFEGEPLRPLADRTAPGLALRDVAGMLRSFGYVAASRPDGGTAWAEACAEAFLAGYEAVAPGSIEPHAPLLRALVLDKALYEASYEARHRPDWLGIPLAALREILG